MNENKDQEQDTKISLLSGEMRLLRAVVKSAKKDIEDLAQRLTDHMDIEEARIEKEETYSKNRMVSSWIATASIIIGLLSFFFYFSDKIFEDRKDISSLQTEVHALPSAITLSIIRELKQNWDFYPPERRNEK